MLLVRQEEHVWGSWDHKARALLHLEVSGPLWAQRGSSWRVVGAGRCAPEPTDPGPGRHLPVCKQQPYLKGVGGWSAPAPGAQTWSPAFLGEDRALVSALSNASSGGPFAAAESAGCGVGPAGASGEGVALREPQERPVGGGCSSLLPTSHLMWGVSLLPSSLFPGTVQ